MPITTETREWAARIPQDLNQAGIHSSVERVTTLGMEMEQVVRCITRESEDIQARQVAKEILGCVESFKERVIPAFAIITSLKEELQRAREENHRLAGDLGQVQQLRAEHIRMATNIRESEQIIAALSKAMDDAKTETETLRHEKGGLEEEMEKMKGQNASLERKARSKEVALEQVKLDFGKRIKSRDEELETVKRQREALKDKEIKYKSQVEAMSRENERLRQELKRSQRQARTDGPFASTSNYPASDKLVDLDSDEDDYDGAPLPTPPLSSDPAWESEPRRTAPSVVPQKRKADLPIALDRNGKPKGCVQLGSRRRW
ncbi:hypothetical protein GLOTRDRAFT_138069 [Gloeophyllum trabeum ATCC 11539]|uniref:Uncharacterized protein n=1 Tax=Gloeophyllum trabeum (strain ATCC 11539 / FP-39264 / Madison 617) TaxID=670483 RepID=S7Q9V0_GLOTA|nr:uncharacterized protein GLOTRDRAFT_138069 [Gloeophyllum trabeum ATCC 11539]EPQ56297.1 hypothetical protein GLOTRDRAFT_138069 [Gloeophyllum trabeum ATCC 11539]